MRHISKKQYTTFSSIIAILGGFKGRLHLTVDVVYFLYAINVKTINTVKKKKHLKRKSIKKYSSASIFSPPLQYTLYQ